MWQVIRPRSEHALQTFIRSFGVALSADSGVSCPWINPPLLLRSISSTQQSFVSAPAGPALPADVGVTVPHSELHVTPINPFSIVEEELGTLAKQMQNMVVSEVPKLAQAAEYFFRMGAAGKKFRPTILLLFASALSGAGRESGADEVRIRQRKIAEITEMIHVASLLHDDVLDHADTRRGVGSLNSVMGNKLAVLAGDFLLARASVALASLRNVEVIELLSKVLEHLVTGEIMQMAAEADHRNSMDYYQQKTYYKTASLIANSTKSIAILGGQNADVAALAHDYGRHLGMAYQLVDDMLDFTGTTASLGKPALSDLRQGIATAPVLFAAQQFPGLKQLIARRFKSNGDVDQALEWVRQSEGLRKTKEMAEQHAHEAMAAIGMLPDTESDHAILCRRALVDLAHLVLTRSK